MTVLDESRVVDAPLDVDWRPIAHLANFKEERPTHGLCGAPILGIPAFGDYEHCEECEEIDRRWRALR